MTLEDWFKQAEWYDNHKLSTILNCKRKAWLHLEFKPDAGGKGLEAPVGDGARIGSAFHAGIGAYNASWGMLESARRVKAYRAFGGVYNEKFKEPPEKSAHGFDNCISIMDAYFDFYQSEDQLWRPVETELMLIVPVKPRDKEHFDPFFFVMRSDGVWERIRDGSWYVMELKNISGGVSRELKRLAISRQCEGYTWGLRQMREGHKIVGVLGNVILVAAEKREFGRDIFVKSELETEMWRIQTINIVEEWRKLKQSVVGGNIHEVFTTFYKNDQHCTHYGLCPYYDVCRYGIALASTIGANRWTPLMGEKEDV